MAGRYAHACTAAKIAHRKAERWGGLQPGIQQGRDAVGRQHPRRFTRKTLRAVAAVVRNGHTLGQIGLIEIIRKALRSLAHGINIHAVGAHAQLAPQAARAKGKITAKTVF